MLASANKVVARNTYLKIIFVLKNISRIHENRILKYGVSDSSFVQPPRVLYHFYMKCENMVQLCLYEGRVVVSLCIILSFSLKLFLSFLQGEFVKLCSVHRETSELS